MLYTIAPVAVVPVVDYVVCWYTIVPVAVVSVVDYVVCYVHRSLPVAVVSVVLCTV